MSKRIEHLVTRKPALAGPGDLAAEGCSVLEGQSGMAEIVSLPVITMTALTGVATLSLSRRRLERWDGVAFALLYVLVVWGAFHVGAGQMPAAYG